LTSLFIDFKTDFFLHGVALRGGGGALLLLHRVALVHVLGGALLLIHCGALLLIGGGALGLGLDSNSLNYRNHRDRRIDISVLLSLGHYGGASV